MARLTTEEIPGRIPRTGFIGTPKPITTPESLVGVSVSVILIGDLLLDGGVLLWPL
jgi:hypothetical protein